MNWQFNVVSCVCFELNEILCLPTLDCRCVDQECMSSTTQTGSGRVPIEYDQEKEFICMWIVDHLICISGNGKLVNII